MKLYFLGPEETFSHRTATRMARPGDTLVPCTDFREVFRRASEDSEGAAIVPFENTTRGTVTEVLDFMAATPNLFAAECRSVPVHQHLLSLDLTTPIRRILSKAEALAQCRDTLGHMYPTVPLIAVSSTAEAARMASEDPTSAAIAGETTGERYGLTVRRPDCQDTRGNTTRFLRLEHRHPENGRLPNRASLPATHALLLVTINDRPGSLMEVLEPIRDIDMTYIESRPIPGEHWKYTFFIELLTGTTGRPPESILSGMRARARDVRVLGMYTITTQPTAPDPRTTTALSSLRAMIADIDADLVRAFRERAAFRTNPDAYVHSEPVSHDDLAKAFAQGDATEQTRRLRRYFLNCVIPAISLPGNDANARQAIHADTDIMNVLARRFRFAMRVIARKRVELAPEMRAAADSGDADVIEHALLNATVEAKVLARVARNCKAAGATEEEAERILTLYYEHILPVSRRIQVHCILSNM